MYVTCNVQNKSNKKKCYIHFKIQKNVIDQKEKEKRENTRSAVGVSTQGFKNNND